MRRVRGLGCGVLVLGAVRAGSAWAQQTDVPTASLPDVEVSPSASPPESGVAPAVDSGPRAGAAAQDQTAKGNPALPVRQVPALPSASPPTGSSRAPVPVAAQGAVSSSLQPLPGYAQAANPAQNAYPPPEAHGAGTTGPPPDRVTTPERERDPNKERVRLSIEAVTRAPVDVGVQLRLQTPNWLRFTLGAGIVPSAYIGVVNSAVGGTDAFDRVSAADVASSFRNGLSYNLRVGLRPSKKAGLYIDAGYANVQLDGKLEVGPSAQIGGGASGSQGFVYGVDTGLDLAMFEIGWEHEFGSRVLLGMGLGLLVTLDSKTTATPESSRARTVDPEIEGESTALLDESIESYGYVPTLSLRLGFDLL